MFGIPSGPRARHRSIASTPSASPDAPLAIPPGRFTPEDRDSVTFVDCMSAHLSAMSAIVDRITLASLWDGIVTAPYAEEAMRRLRTQVPSVGDKHIHALARQTAEHIKALYGEEMRRRSQATRAGRASSASLATLDVGRILASALDRGLEFAAGAVRDGEHARKRHEMCVAYLHGTAAQPEPAFMQRKTARVSRLVWDPRSLPSDDDCDRGGRVAGEGW